MEPLLFLAHRIPFPPDKGDKIRSFHLLKHLAERYRVFLGTFVDDPEDRRHVHALQGLCEEVCVRPIVPALARMGSLRGIATGEALTLPYYRDRRLARWVDAVVRRERIARALVFSSAMAQYTLGRPGIGSVVDFVDVDSDKWAQYARRRRWPFAALFAREARALLDFERLAAADAHACLFVSEAEASLFSGLAPESASRIHAVRNGVDAAHFWPDPGRRSPFRSDEEAVVLTGAMDYWPNVDAACWFAREILPRVAAARPRARFYVVGMNPAPAVRALARDPRVTVTGRVDDVRPYLQHAKVVVAPVRVARGVQNKVLEAMAMARPVVASSACARVLSAVPGREILTADSADVYAARTVGVLQSDGREALGAAARARVLLDYAWTRNLGRVALLLEGAARSVGHRPASLGGSEPAATPDEARA